MRRQLLTNTNVAKQNKNAKDIITDLTENDSTTPGYVSPLTKENALVQLLKRVSTIVTETIKTQSATPAYVSPLTEAQKLILLFKMVAAIVNMNISLESVAFMQQYAIKVIDKVDGIEYFSHLLT